MSITSSLPSFSTITYELKASPKMVYSISFEIAVADARGIEPTEYSVGLGATISSLIMGCSIVFAGGGLDRIGSGFGEGTVKFGSGTENESSALFFEPTI